MQETGFCQKDNIETPMDKGCRHPLDYCQYRQACIVHFLEKESTKKSGAEDEREGLRGKKG